MNASTTEGVVVLGLRQGPAASAGIEQYDIILSVNGQRVTDTSSLLKLVADSPIGGFVTIELMRDGKRLTVKVPVERQGQRATLRRRG